MPINPRSAFCLSFLSILLFPIFFPKWHLFYMAPYLVTTYYSYSRYQVLWRAAGCGVLIDLFSSTSFFGLSSLNYCFVSWILYNQRRNFFADKTSTLPLMTFLFSSVSTLFSMILGVLFEKKHTFSALWLLSDIIVMPAADGLYALLVFSLPFQVIYRLKKMYR